MVVLDKYTHSSLVCYERNGDDEPYDCAYLSYYDHISGRNMLQNTL